jgi:hypothetical protein
MFVPTCLGKMIAYIYKRLKKTVFSQTIICSLKCSVMSPVTHTWCEKRMYLSF